MIWRPDCEHVRLIRFGDELERLAGGRFDLGIDHPAGDWPESGTGNALDWLAVIFPEAAGGISAAATWFGISESRAVSLLDRSAYPEEWRDHLIVAVAVRQYALAECTEPGRRKRKRKRKRPRLKVFQ